VYLAQHVRVERAIHTGQGSAHYGHVWATAHAVVGWLQCVVRSWREKTAALLRCITGCVRWRFAGDGEGRVWRLSREALPPRVRIGVVAMVCVQHHMRCGRGAASEAVPTARIA